MAVRAVMQGTRPGGGAQALAGAAPARSGGNRRRCSTGPSPVANSCRQLLAAAARDLALVSGPLHLLAFTSCQRHVRSRPRPGACTPASSLLDAQLMLSRPFYAGRFHLKAVLGNPNTGSGGTGTSGGDGGGHASMEPGLPVAAASA
jgi:hypothetical protein